MAGHEGQILDPLLHNPQGGNQEGDAAVPSTGCCSNLYNTIFGKIFGGVPNAVAAGGGAPLVDDVIDGNPNAVAAGGEEDQPVDEVIEEVPNAVAAGGEEDQPVDEVIEEVPNAVAAGGRGAPLVDDVIDGNPNAVAAGGEEDQPVDEVIEVVVHANPLGESRTLCKEKGTLWRTFFELFGVSDNSNASLVGVVAAFLGCIATVNFAVQGYHASLPFAWFFFALSFAGTCFACILSYTSIPPMVRCIDEVSREARDVDARAEALHRSANTNALSEGQLRSFHGNISSVLNGRILPSRLIQRQILLCLVLVFGVVFAYFAIFGRYEETAKGGPGAPPPRQ